MSRLKYSVKLYIMSSLNPTYKNFGLPKSRLGMSVTTQGSSGRQCVTGPGRNIPKYRFVSLNVYRFGET